MLTTLISALIIPFGLGKSGILLLYEEQASPNTLYVAPSANCGGQSPCYATIQEAVDIANNGDTIKVAEGIYTALGFEVVYINKSVFLNGGYSFTNWNTPDPNNHPSIIDSQNGDGRRGIVIDGTDLSDVITVKDFTIKNGHLFPESNGAGIEIVNGLVLLEENLIINNVIDDRKLHDIGFGGGIHILNGNITIQNNIISDNIAPHGAGIFITNGNVSISGNSILRNNSIAWQPSGGGVAVIDGTIDISNNTISNNYAHRGGGISVKGGNVIVNQNTLDGNSTGDYDGGGIVQLGGNLTITNNTIQNNTANTFGGGGGISVISNISTQIEGNLLEGNSASWPGGGVYFYHNTGGENILVKNNIFRNNHSGQTGGAIHVSGNTLITDGNRLIDNTAYQHGGALSSSGATLQAQNDIIVGNSTPMEAVYIADSSSLTAKHWTIADNGNYAVVSSNSSTINITNCIIAGHVVAGLYGTGATSTRSLFYGNGSTCAGGAVCSDSISGDPKFANPSMDDYHLSIGSAAIDTGIDAGVVIDFEGDPRPIEAGYDIGADEIIFPPEAGFTNTVTSWVGVETVFTNTSISSGTTTYEWDFGDGASSGDINPSHTYLSPGSYSISLTVTNRAGTDTANGLINIPYAANFTTTSPEWLGDTTSFTNTTITSGSTTYSWDFGDGTFSNEINPFHVYSLPGSYNVTLVATNNDGSGIKNNQVIVYGPPTPSFTSTTPDWFGQSTTFNGSVIITPTGDNTILSEWDFGDGTSTSGSLNTSHIYTSPGTYLVTLTVSNAAGSNGTQDIVIINAPTVQYDSATYEVNEDAGSAIITVTLDQASESQVRVDYSAIDGTATNGSDFTSAAGTITFDPGQVSRTFVVPILEDLLSEPGETVQLSLTNSSNAILGTPASAILTIQDDNPPIITDLDPTSTLAGSQGILLNIYGSGFIQGVSVIQWNGIALPTTFISNNHLTIQLDSLQLASPSFVDVAVLNPNPSGGASNSYSFAINSPPLLVCPDEDPQELVFQTAAGQVQASIFGITSCGTITVNAFRGATIQVPTGFNHIPTSFDISESGTGFTKISVKLPIFPIELSGLNIPVTSLRLLHYANDHWVDVTTQLDLQNLTISGEMDTLSPLVIGVYNIANCSISINNGALFTGSLIDLIFSNTPDAGEIMLSNDAGFIGAIWKPYQSVIQWNISDPGAQIVTLNVYARLRAADQSVLCSGSNLSDDIIYDPLPPSVSFQFQGITSSNLKSLKASQEITTPVTLIIDSEDQVGGSGVVEMQISTNQTFTGAKWIKYDQTVIIYASIGDTVYIRTRDGAGNVSQSYSRVITDAWVSLPLVTGWNLVSFRLHPTSTAITDVLSSLAGNYDLLYAWDASGAHAGAGNWMRYAPGIPGNTLATLDETQGFWIRMTTADTLEMTGSVPTTTNISLSTNASGWNLVGYPSDETRSLPEALETHGVTAYTLVYAYHANDSDTWKRYAPGVPGNDLLEVAPGWGYWIKVGTTSTWDVEY
jgi:PKD repeat protein